MKANTTKSIKNQRGLGMLQWALVIAIAGFFLLFAFKVIPLYAENRYVESALRSLETGGEKLEQMTDTEIKSKLNNFYMINNVRSEGPTANIKIERESEKAVVTVDYETRVPLFWNIDLVVSFQNHLDSTRPGQCCKPVAPLKTKYFVLTLKYQRLEQRLGYHFEDQRQLQLALTHRSHGATNNERLEFLGDSILNFIVGEELFKRFPEVREGQLSRLRSQMVKGDTLAELAREFELGECLVLGEGEMKSGGHRRDSILADSVEAIIGAIYLASGLDICRERVLTWFAPRLNELGLNTSAKDSKSRLQEYMQAQRQPLPEYVVVDVGGEGHAQMFTVECRVVLTKQPTSATASSRREAEKQAAVLMLAQLKID